MSKRRRAVLSAAILLSPIVFAPFLWAASLANPYRLAHRAAGRNNLLPVWLEFQARRNEYLVSPDLRVLYISAAGWVDSYLGEYRSAFAMAALERKPQPLEDGPELRRALEQCHPVDALEAIAEAARDRRVVMINEEHRDPSHRAFTTELLPILREQGFRYLAAEAFPPTFAVAQYPRVSRGSTDDAGFTNDPVFGDMIRRAKDLGFTFVSYEMDPHCGPGPQKGADDWLTNYGACIERREQG